MMIRFVPVLIGSEVMIGSMELYISGRHTQVVGNYVNSQRELECVSRSQGLQEQLTQYAIAGLIRESLTSVGSLI